MSQNQGKVKVGLCQGQEEGSNPIDILPPTLALIHLLGPTYSCTSQRAGAGQGRPIGEVEAFPSVAPETIETVWGRAQHARHI